MGSIHFYIKYFSSTGKMFILDWRHSFKNIFSVWKGPKEVPKTDEVVEQELRDSQARDQ